jgi:hypothetical protein
MEVLLPIRGSLYSHESSFIRRLYPQRSLWSRSEQIVGGVPTRTQSLEGSVKKEAREEEADFCGPFLVHRALSGSMFSSACKLDSLIVCRLASRGHRFDLHLGTLSGEAKHS